MENRKGGWWMRSGRMGRKIIFLWIQMLLIQSCDARVAEGALLLKKVINVIDKIRNQVENDAIEANKQKVQTHEWCSDEKIKSEEVIRKGKLDIDAKKAITVQNQATQDEGNIIIEELISKETRLEKRVSVLQRQRNLEKRKFSINDETTMKALETLEKQKQDLSENGINSPALLQSLRDEVEHYRQIYAAEELNGSVMMSDGGAGENVPLSRSKIDTAEGSLTSFFDKVVEDSTQVHHPSFLQVMMNHPLIGSLTDTMRNLTKTRRELQAEEARRILEFKNFSMALKKQLQLTSSALDKKKRERSQAAAEQGEIEGEIPILEKMIQLEKEDLDKLNISCVTKMEEFEQIRQSRKEEVVALEKAISVLESDLSSTSFLQVQNVPRNSSKASFLSMSEKAMWQDKMRKMLETMIAKLLSAQADSVAIKAWCDKELSQTKSKMTKSISRNESLNEFVQEITAKIQAKVKEHTDLTAALSELMQGLKDAALIRDEEKRENERLLKEAEGFLSLLQRAMDVLKDYYEKKSVSFAAASAGHNSVRSSVLNVLEIAVEDMSKLRSETETAEHEGLRNYEDYSKASEVTKAVIETQLKHNSQDRERLIGLKGETEADLVNGKNENDATAKYFDGLNTKCSGGTREEQEKERTERRQRQIKSLQNALAVLSGGM